MRIRKRWIAALACLCMVLTLLPTSALAAAETRTEVKQLTSFSDNYLAYFSDGTSYFVETTNGLDIHSLGDYVGSWFTCVIESSGKGDYIVEMSLADGGGQAAAHAERSASVEIDIPDVEKAGDTYRLAGSSGAFEPASTFRIPVTVIVMNTTSGHADGGCLTVSSVTLHGPARFELELTDDQREDWSEETVLSPGEWNEYDGYLKVDDSVILRQAKDLEYTIYAAVESDLETLEGSGVFTVMLAAEEEPASSGGDEYDWLPVEELDKITDPASAVAAVKVMLGRMTDEQKKDPGCIDLATLFAETASSRVATKVVSGSSVTVDFASAKELSELGAQTLKAVESTLIEGGVTPGRELINTIAYDLRGTNRFDLNCSPNVSEAGFDRLEVKTDSFSVIYSSSTLGNGSSLGTSASIDNSTQKVTVNMPNGQTTNPIMVEAPKGSGNTTYQAFVKEDGSAVPTNYNPVTRSMRGRINTPGTYGVMENKKNFTDISSKSAEMQNAILCLAARGIINGTSATEFSPDRSINRQQIAALLMRGLGKVDNTATATFTDVPKSSSLYHAIASSQKHKVINGYPDNTFRGANIISKVQIVAVSGRVLTTEMDYKAPANPGTYLKKYSDTIPEYARSMVALATREDLVSYRPDGTFSGDLSMTRGDAAIILYRLFRRIW